MHKSKPFPFALPSRLRTDLTLRFWWTVLTASRGLTAVHIELVSN